MERDRFVLDGWSWCLLLSFLLLFVFSLLFVFRVVDDNTLTSWQWTVGTVGIRRLLLLLSVALVFSLAFFRLRIPEAFPLPVLTLAAAMAVVPLWREPELLLDSGRYFLQAKSLSEHGVLFFAREWGHRIMAWTDLPLVPFLYGLIFSLAGESRTPIQFFNTLVFVLAVLVTFRTGAMLWNRSTGLHAALLLLGIPYLLTQVPLMLVDIHAMFLLILALFCFLTGLRATGFFPIIVAAAAVFLAGAVKFSTWPMLVLLPFCGLLYLPEQPARTCRRSAAVFLIVALAAVPVVVFFYPVLRQQVLLLWTYQRPALRLWHESAPSTFLFQVHPFITMLAAAGGFLAIRTRDRRFLIPLLPVALIPFLQIQRIRYLLPLFPFIVLLAARGLEIIREADGRRYAVLLVVSSSMVLAWGAFLPFFNTTSMVNLQRAGRFIDTLAGDRVEVHALPQAGSDGNTLIGIAQLDLFTRKKIFSPQGWGPAGEHLPPLSPLLATWKLRRPAWYGDEAVNAPLVIISGQPLDGNGSLEMGAALPPGRVRYFTLCSGVFRYRTFVSVYY